MLYQTLIFVAGMCFGALVGFCAHALLAASKDENRA